MSLPNCIPGLIADGKIRKGDGAAAQRAYDRHYKRLAQVMGPDAAAAEASMRALDELDYAAQLKRRQAGLTIKAQQRLDGDLDAAEGRGRPRYRALTAELRGVTIAADRIQRQTHDQLHGFIQQHRRNLIGQSKDKTGLVDVVDELHGKATGNGNAAAFAHAIGDTFESLRLRFNRAGGDIARRADFGMPHHYDPLSVRRKGLDFFRERMLAELAPEKMVDPATGGAFTPERLEEFIAAAFDNIRSGGLAGDGPGGSARMLANRRSDPRHFVFRDGAAWLRIHEEFGSGNPFEAVFAHIHGMAHDIALMERFGPNPSATWRRAMDQAARADANGDADFAGSVNSTSRMARRADKLWRYVGGDLTVPALPDGDGLLARLGRGAINQLHGLRNVLTGALLGSAQLTSIADVNTQIFARKMNALPQLGVAMGYLKMMNPLDASHRRRAVYLGAGMRDATRGMLSLARFYDDTHGPAWSQILSDGVLRVTGLNKFFEAGQRLWIDDYAATLAGERGLAFADLPPERREAFDRGGISEKDWDVMRAAEPYRDGGREFMDWHRVAEADSQVADRMQDMLLDEARTAVVEADAETHALLRWDRPGTAAGEFGANMFQFKSFPVALMLAQGRRIADISERHGGAAAAKYGASFIVGMTMMGAITLQLRELSKGKDLRPMVDENGVPLGEFWLDALLQSGGLGIISDIIGSVTEGRVSGLAKLVGGPVVQFGDEVVRTAKDMIPGEGEEFAPGKPAVRLARRYTPGTNIWYARAAIDRLIWDELDERVNVDHDADQARLIERAEADGQGYFYEPGEGFPDRLPEMGQSPE